MFFFSPLQASPLQSLDIMDELINQCISEIAYDGLAGCSLKNLFLKNIFSTGKKKPQEKQESDVEEEEEEEGKAWILDDFVKQKIWDLLLDPETKSLSFYRERIGAKQVIASSSSKIEKKSPNKSKAKKRPHEEKTRVISEKKTKKPRGEKEKDVGKTGIVLRKRNTSKRIIFNQDDSGTETGSDDDKEFKMDEDEDEDDDVDDVMVVDEEEEEEEEEEEAEKVKNREEDEEEIEASEVGKEAKKADQNQSTKESKLYKKASGVNRSDRITAEGYLGEIPREKINRDELPRNYKEALEFIIVADFQTRLKQLGISVCKSKPPKRQTN